MNAKKGSYVVFKLGGKADEGVVVGSIMGMVNIMTKDGNVEITQRDITEVKGSVFEAKWKDEK